MVKLHLSLAAAFAACTLIDARNLSHLRNPSSPTNSPSIDQISAPTTFRSEVERILAEYAPLDQQTMTWLTETSTWKPDEGDLNSDYLWLERYALALLYYSTNGPSWTQNANWLTDEPVCKWFNQESNSCSGPMTHLVLPSNDLRESLPIVLVELTALTKLNLRWNQLTGSIPSSIGNLSSLEYLDLGWNQLTGSIPSSIGNLSSLQTLWLRNNDLTGSIPSSIGNLSSLQHLWLNFFLSFLPLALLLFFIYFSPEGN